MRWKNLKMENSYKNRDQLLEALKKEFPELKVYEVEGYNCAALGFLLGSKGLSCEFTYPVEKETYDRLVKNVYAHYEKELNILRGKNGRLA